MKTTQCDICLKTDIPVNNTLRVDEKLYCDACLKEAFPDSDDLSEHKIQYQHDPTICAACSKDFGDKILNLHGSFPICDECKERIDKQTFPLWVKGMLAFILVAVIAGWVLNWKYYTAYNNVSLFFEKLNQGNIEEAHSLMADTYKKVPEVHDFYVLERYTQGQLYLMQDKNDSALAAFNIGRDYLPPEYELEFLILQANMGIAYSDSNFIAFRDMAYDFYKKDTTQVQSISMVASGNACVYAYSGDSAALNAALYYIDKSWQMDSVSEENRSYIDRILYRIDSKMIIEREVFDKQFPNGYKIH